MNLFLSRIPPCNLKKVYLDMKKIIPSDLDAQRSHDRLFLTLLIGCAFLLSSLTFAAITQFWAGPPYAPLMANALSILTGIAVLISGQYLLIMRNVTFAKKTHLPLITLWVS